MNRTSAAPTEPQPMSVRFGRELEAEIRRASKATGLSKVATVRQSVAFGLPVLLDALRVKGGRR